MSEAYQEVNLQKEKKYILTPGGFPLLLEDNMDLMKKAAGGAMQTIKFKDGKLKVDSFTASAIMAVYKAVNPKNKKSIEQMVNTGTKAQMMKLQSLAMKQIKSGDELEHDGEELDEGYSKKEIKMAIGIASDPRYKQGNYSGAVKAIEKIKKGLSQEKQVAAVLKKQNEEVELDEEVSVKDFDALKKGDTITVEYKSAMSSGKGTFTVTAKNKVAKGKVEKVTLKSVKNPGGVKHFLYKRDDKVSFAQGDMGASVVGFKKEEVELEEGRMKELQGYIDDKKSPEWISKKMKIDVKTIKSLMGEDITVTGATKGGEITEKDIKYVEKELHRLGITDARVSQNEMDFSKINIETKRSDKDVKKAFDRSKMTVTYVDEKRDIDPADIDHDATDDDVKSADKNIIMQMRKVVSLRGNFKVEFRDGKKQKIDPKIAMAVQDKFQKLRKPDDKEKFMKKAAASYKEMLSALKESLEEEQKQRMGADGIPCRKTCWTQGGKKPKGIKEGTWALPDTPKLKAGLKKLMQKPIPLGKDGDSATDAIGKYIGDDGLYDALYDAGKKDGPKADARPVIRGWMDREFVDSWKKYRIESRTILDRIDNKIQARKNG
tara:strand:- start:833 stop:2641 length:1809 start_codon:yes stop_codon:yes gene_type:complete